MLLRAPTGSWRRPGRGDGLLPAVRTRRPGPALRGRWLAALPGGRLRTPVDRLRRAVLDRAWRSSPPRRTPQLRSLPGAASGHGRVQRRDLRPDRGASGQSIDANLDPSHFFWMGMDGAQSRGGPGRAGRARARQGHRSSTQSNLALNGLLDARLAPARRPDAVDVRASPAAATTSPGGRSWSRSSPDSARPGHLHRARRSLHPGDGSTRGGDPAARRDRRGRLTQPNQPNQPSGGWSGANWTGDLAKSAARRRISGRPPAVPGTWSPLPTVRLHYH